MSILSRRLELVFSHEGVSATGSALHPQQVELGGAKSTHTFTGDRDSGSAPWLMQI